MGGPVHTTASWEDFHFELSYNPMKFLDTVAVFEEV